MSFVSATIFIGTKAYSIALCTLMEAHKRQKFFWMKNIGQKQTTVFDKYLPSKYELQKSSSVWYQGFFFYFIIVSCIGT